MLLPAISTVLTVLQAFPFDTWDLTSRKEHGTTSTGRASSKLGWKLHVNPAGSHKRHENKFALKVHDSNPPSGRLQIANSSIHRSPTSRNHNAWEIILADSTNQFMDSMSKQVLDNTIVAATPVRRKTDLTRILAGNKNTTLPKPDIPEPKVVKRPCEDISSLPAVKKKPGRLSLAAVVFMNSTRVNHPRVTTTSSVQEVAIVPVLDGRGMSTAPLTESKSYGFKIFPTETPNLHSVQTLPSMTRSDKTSTKRRRLLRTKTRPTNLGSPRLGSTRAILNPSQRPNGTRDDAVHLRTTASVPAQANTTNSKPKRLRRRKKRPKLNLFQPRRRQLMDVAQNRPKSGDCLSAETPRHDGSCQNATTDRPRRQQLQKDQMTESSVMRPRVYGFDLGSKGTERRSPLMAQPADRGNREMSEEPVTGESHESYYDYSPEYHGGYYSDEYQESGSDETSRELGRRDRGSTESNASSDEFHSDANSTRKTTPNATSSTQGRIAETNPSLNATAVGEYHGTALNLASQNALRLDTITDSAEGFKLLVDDSNSSYSNVHQKPPNLSTEIRNGVSQGVKPDAATPRSESVLTATVKTDRSNNHVSEELQETPSTQRNTGYSQFFSFAEVPAPGQHRFGYRKGNGEHFTGRLELAKGPHVKSVVVWGDKKGGYGKHILDYNHKA